ncbi:nucleotide exchange factor GrpE [Halospeciosus flavus]|uniref:Protein GrpE n=1 Tax=Halospeciosus flavus TaxID=3032283 RepID=A0ABD5Z512_9EURY|nr:nucleotide exchange factor GrpE [Halospeciosus flavus]
MTDDAEQAVEDRESAADADASDAEETENETVPEPTLAERVGEYDEELAAEVEALRAERDELAAQVEEKEEEVESLTERLQRTQADFQNYKKRAKQKQEDIRERATEDLVEDLLDVHDNLRRALEEESGDVESLREGVELTKKEFDHVLEGEGVEMVAPDPGDEVDPTRHEVMMRQESERPEGTVVDLYRPGYEMGGKVLREAQVTVSAGGE